MTTTNVAAAAAVATAMENMNSAPVDFVVVPLLPTTQSPVAMETTEVALLDKVASD